MKNKPVTKAQALSLHIFSSAIMCLSYGAIGYFIHTASSLAVVFTGTTLLGLFVAHGHVKRFLVHKQAMHQLEAVMEAIERFEAEGTK